MYKALLIDDEQPAIQALRALGQWETLGVTEIMEASDGQSGLDMLREHKPDIVMVDMKMPRMTGTQFLDEAVVVHPDAKYIVVSGFDDYVYTRQAIKSGALDYLLKPIKRRELADVLERAVRKLDADRESQRRTISSGILLNISAPLLKEKVFASLMDASGRYHQMKELEQLLELNPAATMIAVGTAAVLNLGEVCERKFKNDAPAFYYAFTNGLNELCGEGAFSFKSAASTQLIVAVLPVAVNGKDEGRRQAAGRFRAALARLGELFGTQCAAAVSPGICKLAALNEGYDAALLRLGGVNLLVPGASGGESGKPVVLFAPDEDGIAAESDSGALPSLLERKEGLLQALESSGLRYAETMLEEYWAAIRAGGVFTAAQMRKTSSELRLLAEAAMERLDAPAEERAALLRSFDAALMGRLALFDVYAEDAMKSLHPLFERLAESGQPEDKLIPDKIKAYIDAHYAEDISIATFTRQYYASKEHLLRVFKAKFGFGIYEYTTKVRMEHAKKLLADPDIRVQSVGEHVGFDDVSYFRKAFKKHVGLSPSEYREQAAAQSPV